VSSQLLVHYMLHYIALTAVAGTVLYDQTMSHTYCLKRSAGASINSLINTDTISTTCTSDTTLCEQYKLCTLHTSLKTAAKSVSSARFLSALSALLSWMRASRACSCDDTLALPLADCRGLSLAAVGACRPRCRRSRSCVNCCNVLSSLSTCCR
jgi:hypothetical protein